MEAPIRQILYLFSAVPHVFLGHSPLFSITFAILQCGYVSVVLCSNAVVEFSLVCLSNCEVLIRKTDIFIFYSSYIFSIENRFFPDTIHPDHIFPSFHSSQLLLLHPILPRSTPVLFLGVGLQETTTKHNIMIQ